MSRCSLISGFQPRGPCGGKPAYQMSKWMSQRWPSLSVVDVRSVEYTLARVEGDALAFGDQAHAMAMDMEVNVIKNRVNLMPTQVTESSTILSRTGKSLFLDRGIVQFGHSSVYDDSVMCSR